LQSHNIEEIEKEVNQILYSIFKGEISVVNVLDKLINYKNSQNQKEVEIYVVLIYCIFDEYQFYYQYP